MNKVDSLQTVRAVAAIMVVIDHSLNQLSKFREYGTVLDHYINSAKYLGNIGVMVFFIVSGWIMILTTDNKNWTRNFAKVFILKRIFRVLPLYWIYLTILVGLYLLGFAFHNGYYSPEKILSSYFLIPYKDFATDGINPVLPQAWTLIYEMFFYGLFSLSILFLSKRFNIYFISFVFAFLFISSLWVKNNSAFQSFSSNPITIFFIVGMLLYRMKLNTELGKYLRLSLLLIFIILTFALFTFSYSKDIEFILTGLSSIVLFIYIFTSAHNAKIVMYIGDASYSIYLIHIFVTLAFGTLLKKTNTSMCGDFLLLLGTILGSIILGCVSYYIVERRLIKFLNNTYLKKA